MTIEPEIQEICFFVPFEYELEDYTINQVGCCIEIEIYNEKDSNRMIRNSYQVSSSELKHLKWVYCFDRHVDLHTPDITKNRYDNYAVFHLRFSIKD